MNPSEFLDRLSRGSPRVRGLDHLEASPSEPPCEGGAHRGFVIDDQDRIASRAFKARLVSTRNNSPSSAAMLASVRISDSSRMLGGKTRPASGVFTPVTVELDSVTFSTVPELDVDFSASPGAFELVDPESGTVSHVPG